jgi:hypothetical protein
MAKKPTEIYQLKVSLKDSKPPIWRRILVPGDITLERLHYVIQETMGWWNAHLHQFIVGEIYYGEPHPDLDWGDIQDERQFRLNQIAPGVKSKFVYEYDFGDSWEHVVLVEKVLPPEAGQRYPLCVKGKRACPPEDVGGVWGYAYFLNAIQDPEHERHEDYLEWVGYEFDPEAFDLDEVNEALERLR